MAAQRAMSHRKIKGPWLLVDRVSTRTRKNPLKELIPGRILRAEISQPISFSVRIANLAVVILLFLGLVIAVVGLWGRGFRWIEPGLLAGMYVLTGLGITVGFHRLFTHRAFEGSGTGWTSSMANLVSLG